MKEEEKKNRNGKSEGRQERPWRFKIDRNVIEVFGFLVSGAHAGGCYERATSVRKEIASI